MKTNSYELMVKILKDLLLQYYEQMEQSINRYKETLDLNDTRGRDLYKCCVQRAETYQKSLKTIILNLEKSIFDGEIYRNTVHINVPQEDGTIKKSVQVDIADKTSEEYLTELRKMGINCILTQTCIQVDIIPHILYYSYMMLIGEENQIKIPGYNNGIPKDMVFEFGNLTINSSLWTNIKSNRLMPFTKYENVSRYDQLRKFKFDVKRTHAIIRQHLSKEGIIDLDHLILKHSNEIYSLFKDLCELSLYGNINLEEELEILKFGIELKKDRRK